MNSELYNYYIIERGHHSLRRDFGKDVAEEYSKLGLSAEERMCRRFEEMCRRETPHIHPSEQIVLVRTVKKAPDILTPKEWEKIRSSHYIHELGYVSNLCPDYEKAITCGLLELRQSADAFGKRVIDAVTELCDRYRAEAEKQNRTDIAEILARVPRYGARTFREALQMFRILHFALWLEGDYHNTVGRFDQYMYHYFSRDMENGTLSEETALELIEDFFISFNKDSDLYPGVQQGDNGQSLVLGGMLPDGSDGFNKLSELCLTASRELRLIDPKINLRVSSETPLEVYVKGTELTKAGLGFPQYSNDDVVIKGLTDLGYDEKDAVNYVVAACWEFIIPGVGNDICNIDGVNFPAVTDRAIRRALSEKPVTDNSNTLLGYVKSELETEINRLTESKKNIWFYPSPFMDLLRDGKKYNNFGLHGSGIAPAADALAAVEKYVYNDKTVTPERLLEALDTNYENDSELLHLLRYEAPKMGTDDDRADRLGTYLLNVFADCLKGRKNSSGGIWRAGTGTAMYYIWHAEKTGATADGRRAGEHYGTNYSPGLFTVTKGPVSVINSFTKQDLSRTINGGPLTLEFVSGLFRNEESVEKVATLIKYFIDRGGHQLQLNAVNPEALRDAQKHPERYRQLVVRVWGWSAYFVELDKEYQDHVLARQEYTV